MMMFMNIISPIQSSRCVWRLFVNYEIDSSKIMLTHILSVSVIEKCGLTWYWETFPVNMLQCSKFALYSTYCFGLYWSILQICIFQCDLIWIWVNVRLSHYQWSDSKNIINTLRPRQNGCHLPNDIFKWIFLNENVWISINISLRFVPRGPINNIPILVQVMAWRRPGDKPLSEPMMVR